MKKAIEWHSPKEYQRGWEFNEDKPIPAKLPKPKSKYCKKLKGDHQFGEWKEVFFSYSKKEHTGFWEKKCVGCGHKKTWIAPDLPGPYWRLDLNARPSEDE